MVNNKRTNDSYIIKLKTTSESENNIFPLKFDPISIIVEF